MSQRFQVYLTDQLTQIKGTRRRLLSAHSKDGASRHGLFRALTLGILLIVGAFGIGVVYTVTRAFGLFEPPGVLRLDDPRWGRPYNRPGQAITGLMALDGQLTVATNGNGVHLYTPSTRLWQTLVAEREPGRIPENAIRWLKSDETRSADAWMLSQNGGLARFGEGEWRTVTGAQPLPGAGTDTLTTAARDGGTVVVGTKHNGIGLLDLATQSWQKAIPGGAAHTGVTAVRAAGEPGVFWVGASNGLWRLANGRMTKAVGGDSPDVNILDLETDGAEVWSLAGEQRQVTRINANGTGSVATRATPMPFAPDEMTAVAQSGETLWIGTRTHGVFSYDTLTRTWIPLALSSGDTARADEITGLAYNGEPDELYVGTASGLFIVTDALKNTSATQRYAFYGTFPGVKKFEVAEGDVYFLTSSGKVGFKASARKAGTSLLTRYTPTIGAGADTLTTLLDVLPSTIEMADITAACQTKDDLFFGTINGTIARYHKASHAWSVPTAPLPFSIDELIYNPFSSSILALAGTGLYLALPPYDQFVFYKNVAADSVRILPTRIGYLLSVDGTSLFMFNETNHRSEMILDGTRAPEPDFEPVSLDISGSTLYFVTDSGSVQTYDLLRHKWAAPPEIPQKNVVDIRSVGHQLVYQTRDNTLYVPGSSPLIGGGTVDLSDTDIRNAVVDGLGLWTAGDRIIGYYDLKTHTWDRSRQINLGTNGAPTAMTAINGKLAYRTGGPHLTGSLWADSQLISQSVGRMAEAGGLVWYTTPSGVLRWNPRENRSSLALDGVGLPREPGERAVDALQIGESLWMATTIRILHYSFTYHKWNVYPAPAGQTINRLYSVAGTIIALTDRSVYALEPAQKSWRRLSDDTLVARDCLAFPNGIAVHYSNGTYDCFMRTGVDFARITRLNTPNAPARMSAAMVTENELVIVTDTQLLRYGLNARSWATPLTVSTTNIRRAVIQENRLWAVLDNDQKMSGPIEGPFRAFTGQIPDKVTAVLGKADDVLIDTPIWRWTRDGEGVSATFKGTLSTLSVFDSQSGVWRFRFDTIRSLARLGDRLLVVNDGLLGIYPTTGGVLSLADVVFAVGPDVSETDRIDFGHGSGPTVDMTITSSSGSAQSVRITAGATSLRGDAIEASTLQNGPEILVEDGFWRWEKSRTSGRVRKFLTRAGTSQEFRLRNGRFEFDDLRSFTVTDGQIWIATSGGIARYPFSPYALSLADLTYETVVAGRDHPEVSLINSRDDTLFCRIGTTDLLRLGSRTEWRTASAAERPMTRQPVKTPFWTWTQSIDRKTVAGVYRDMAGRDRPVTWKGGVFFFDRLADVAWADDAVWVSTEAGIAGYPAYQGYLNVDAIRLYTGFPNAALLSVSQGRPAMPGLYTGHEGKFQRYDASSQTFRPLNSAVQADGARATAFLSQAITHKLLIEDDGFWRCRRKTSASDPPGSPSVLLEVHVAGEWRSAGVSGGGFDFDQARDLVIEDRFIWLATRAGLCRFDRDEGLALTSMIPVWGEQYADATDLWIYAGPGMPHLVFRRGKNNETVRGVALPSLGTEGLTAEDNPFPRLPISVTDYWRWVKVETYNGSVATGSTVALELRDASGQWAPAEFAVNNPVFPFDAARDIFLQDGGLWLATAMGVVRYDKNGPFDFGHAVFYRAEGLLENATRIGVDRTGHLACEVATSAGTRLYGPDERNRWVGQPGENRLESLRFKEDRWYWYEAGGQVEVRYQDDPMQLRQLYLGRFSDQYTQAVTTDGAGLWRLTPAGLLRYAARAKADTLALLDWRAPPDISEDGGASEDDRLFSLIRRGEDWWFLTSRSLLIYRIDEKGSWLFAGRLRLSAASQPYGDGLLSLTPQGLIRIDLRTTNRQDLTALLYDPDSGLLTEQMEMAPVKSLLQTYAGTLPSRSTVTAISEDKRYLWLGTASHLYQIRKQKPGFWETP